MDQLALHHSPWWMQPSHAQLSLSPGRPPTYIRASLLNGNFMGYSAKRQCDCRCYAISIAYCHQKDALTARMDRQ